ncbi:MAG: TrkH family potassium uptake protein [Candidatus Nanohaloarchaea archaeon]|nr:TrkH family potassium uptake protein [Candidatus Nanohaloarchaea archaeon]
MDRVISYYVGLFLKIFSVLLLLPVAVGKYFGESFVQMESFIIAAFISIVVGYLLTTYGERRRPDAIEGMFAATLGWIIAVAIGAYPFMSVLGWGFPDAFFEAMAGFSTTGMSVMQSFQGVPTSLLFWRTFMQWVGGLGILTFFVTVVVEAGGAATSLISAEANKTDAGTIRPSLFNAIKTLWYIYIVFTSLETVFLYLLDVPFFDAVMYAMATMPTGGFTHTAGGIAAYNSLAIEGVVAVFMLAGGTNFLLLYRLLQGDIRSLFRDYEFRLYIKLMAVASFIVGASLFLSSGQGLFEVAKSTLFHVISVTSSTGFELTPVHEFPEIARMTFFLLMFTGACLGSTTGGVKIFRLGVMFKVVVREVRGFSLPNNAMNMVMSKGRKLKEDELTRIVAIFFLWITVIIAGGFILVASTGLSMIQGFQVVTSAVGTMGPVFMSAKTLATLPAVAKFTLAFVMLAGRLELLPIFVLLNVEFVNRLRD